MSINPKEGVMEPTTIIVGIAGLVALFALAVFIKDRIQFHRFNKPTEGEET